MGFVGAVVVDFNTTYLIDRGESVQLGAMDFWSDGYAPFERSYENLSSNVLVNDFKEKCWKTDSKEECLVIHDAYLRVEPATLLSNLSECSLETCILYSEDYLVLDWHVFFSMFKYKEQIVHILEHFATPAVLLASNGFKPPRIAIIIDGGDVRYIWFRPVILELYGRYNTTQSSHFLHVKIPLIDSRGELIGVAGQRDFCVEDGQNKSFFHIQYESDVHQLRYLFCKATKNSTTLK
ncbi:hypothetical protein DSO57_1028999 [Entomophthora muscae]|uniref:Uncharacterized protein n=1 Tax=Entomophthora muscae TaxID=34485 RepID=A0ACC2SQP0_9FUNG|nr:hypothetical protein DSO57_1028999 [Entomophthora muscae]